MARAPVNMMSPSLNLNEDLWGSNPGESTSGNPKLDPFRADQADLSYEWYYAEGSQFAATLFYKDLESFIARAADAETVVSNIKYRAQLTAAAVTFAATNYCGNNRLISYPHLLTDWGFTPTTRTTNPTLNSLYR
jgi:outer membrane receptor protein involved in Fe transport